MAQIYQLLPEIGFQNVLNKTLNGEKAVKITMKAVNSLCVEVALID